MKKILALVCMTWSLSGCSLFHVQKLDVEQGNIITEEKMGALHRGMSVEQVKEVMGNPVLTNIFTPDRMAYVYTFQRGNKPMTVRRVVIIFQGGKVVDVISS